MFKDGNLVDPFFILQVLACFCCYAREWTMKTHKSRQSTDIAEQRQKIVRKYCSKHGLHILDYPCVGSSMHKLLDLCFILYSCSALAVVNSKAQVAYCSSHRNDQVNSRTGVFLNSGITLASPSKTFQKPHVAIFRAITAASCHVLPWFSRGWRDFMIPWWNTAAFWSRWAAFCCWSPGNGWFHGFCPAISPAICPTWPPGCVARAHPRAVPTGPMVSCYGLPRYGRSPRGTRAPRPHGCSPRPPMHGSQARCASIPWLLWYLFPAIAKCHLRREEPLEWAGVDLLYFLFYW